MSDTDTDSEDELTREFAASLFAPTDDPGKPDDPDDDTQVKPPGNFVPAEGNNPQTQDTSDEHFVRILFDNPEGN